jgi:hypothetical protein
VTSAGTLLIRRPVPLRLALAVVDACPVHQRLDAVAEIERAMEPSTWLELVLRSSGTLLGSPLVILEGLRRVFPLYRSRDFLHGEAAEWWATARHPLTIWRGCYEGVNEAGLCYSQDPLTASRYVQPWGCGDARALLIEATVNEGDYIAHRKWPRGELVILALPERPAVVARHELPLTDAFFVERTVPLVPERMAGVGSKGKR